MLEILKSIWNKLKFTPIYYVHEQTPKVLGTPIRRK